MKQSVITDCVNHVIIPWIYIIIMNRKELTFTGGYVDALKILYMPFNYYLFLFIGFSIIFLVVRSLVLRKKNISVELFNKALKNENSGHFEEAVVTYESALNEVKKIRFHGNLKNKIVEKLKVLHTLIEYNNGIRFIR